MFSWFIKNKNYITMEEVSKHNSKNDLWLVIHGKVYNVTNFLERHPGGQKPFLNGAGKDVTEWFKYVKSQHNHKNIKKFMSSLKIGYVKN
jgi:L-lactate dehydrogenase (cytochrome)